MSNTAANIVRIIEVRDTRATAEIGDRFVKLPGTGQIRQCDRCDRDHEIHVTVELSDGTTSVIGVGCARGESMAIQAAIKSAVSAAKTRSRLAAELAAAELKLADARRIWAEVEAMTPPAATTDDGARATKDGDMHVHRMGDAHVWTLPGTTFDAERARALLSGWRWNRYRERMGVGVDVLTVQVRDLARRLATADRKLVRLTARA